MAYIDNTNVKGTLYDIHDTAGRDMLAPAYSTASAYAVGDYVIYNDKLYRCAVAIASGEAWTAAHWTAVDVGGEVGDLKSAVGAIYPQVASNTEPSKNLFYINPKLLDTEIEGLTFGRSADGDSYTINGTCTPTIYKGYMIVPLLGALTYEESVLPAGTYTFTLSDLVGVGFITVKYSYAEHPAISSASYPTIVSHNSLTATVTFEQDAHVFIQIQGGKTYADASFKCQIETGSAATAYERSAGLIDYGARGICAALEGATSALEAYVRDMSPVAYGNDEGIPVPIVTVRDAAPLNAENVSFEIEPSQDGSGDPSPDNVRPITGWTGAKVARCGKNVFDGMMEAGQISASGQNASSNTRTRSKNYIPVKPNVVYAMSRNATVGGIGFRLYDANKEYLGGENTDYFILIRGNTKSEPMGDGDTSAIFKFADKVAYLRFQTLDSVDLSVKYQLELGSTTTAYEPYQGDTFDITFPSEVGTVYGGTVDLTKGKLVVDRATVDMGTLVYNKTSSPSASGRNVFGINVSKVGYGMATRERNAPNTMVSDVYETAQSTIWWVSDIPDFTMSVNASVLYIADSRYEDAASFKSSVSGVQLVYELATPITYDLTPQEIAMLKGVNNLWANTGDISVQYRQDVYTALNNKTNALEDTVGTLEDTVGTLEDTVGTLGALHKDYPEKVAYAAYRCQGCCLMGDEIIWLLYNSAGKVVMHALNVLTGAHRGSTLPDGTDTSVLYHCNDITYNPLTEKYYVATLLESGPIAVLDSSFVYESTIVPVDGNGDSVVMSGVAYDRLNNQYIAFGQNDFNFYFYDSNWNYVKTVTPDTDTELPVRQGIETDGYYLYRTRTDAASASEIPHPHIRSYTMDGHFIEEYTVEQLAGEEIEGIAYDWTNGVFFVDTNTKGGVAQTNVYLLQPNSMAYHAVDTVMYMLKRVVN